MKLFRFIFFLILVLPYSILYSQCSDLGMIHFAGKCRGMAGSGLGVTSLYPGFDQNPASLTGLPYPFIAFSQNVRYYSYELTRWNDGVGGIIFNWQQIRYNFENVQLAIPVSPKMAIGLGAIQKLNPFIHNFSRAVTWSSLFSHQTDGSIYAVTLVSSYQLHQKLSLGMTLYRYFGTITSTIEGDNHGDDATKWAELKNRMYGMNFRLGLIFQTKYFNTGFIFESPFDMELHTKTAISDDKLYARLLPDYSSAKWKLPLILGIGFTFTGFKNWLLTLDLESHHYENSTIQLNLFEFGGQPDWQDLKVIRAGLEFYPFKDKKLPLRIGYAYIPQLYASNISTGSGNSVFDYKNTEQNFKQLYSVGTTFNFQKFSLNFAFEYAFLRWHRDFYTRMLMTDAFREKDFTISSEIVYHFFH